MRKYKLILDLPQHNLKKGAIFEWDEIEQEYTTKELPWFLSPMISKSEIKKSKIFVAV